MPRSSQSSKLRRAITSSMNAVALRCWPSNRRSGTGSTAIEDNARWIGVAELDDFVVGYLELASSAPPRSFARCMCNRRHVELGFGDGLIDAARQEAQRHGCSALEGFALPGDRETKNLYERAGITPARSSSGRGCSRDYLGFQLGARFSMNAVSPSLVSSEAMTRRTRRWSSSSASRRLRRPRRARPCGWPARPSGAAAQICSARCVASSTAWPGSTSRLTSPRS